MTELSQSDRARAAVVDAVQKLAAARLGRGFVPLALVSLFGIVQMFRHGPLTGDYLALALGAPVVAGAMLAYGLRAVHKAMGRRTGPWMGAMGAAGLVPWAFGVYVLGFRGLRPLGQMFSAFEPTTLVGSLIFMALGLRVLWAQAKLAELQRLAHTMTLAVPEEEGGFS